MKKIKIKRRRIKRTKKIKRKTKRKRNQKKTIRNPLKKWKVTLNQN